MSRKPYDDNPGNTHDTVQDTVDGVNEDDDWTVPSGMQSDEHGKGGSAHGESVGSHDNTAVSISKAFDEWDSEGTIIDDGNGKAGDSGVHGKSRDTRFHGFMDTASGFFLSWRGVVSLLILAVAVVLPFAWFNMIQPAIDRHNINTDPAIRRSNAAIVPYDHVWVKTPLDTKEVDANVNDNQLLIKQKDDAAGNTSCLVFHAEGQDPKHEMKATIAFDDSKSRDFFIAQAPVMEQAMRSGKVKVQVCALLTDNEYSALALEALGEVDYNNPRNTWTALNGLLKVDVSGLKTGTQRVNAIMNVVNSLPNAGSKVAISKESLVNGSFLQWSRVMSNANQVEKIPALWLDKDNLSSLDKFRINNPDELFNKIMNLK